MGGWKEQATILEEMLRKRYPRWGFEFLNSNRPVYHTSTIMLRVTSPITEDGHLVARIDVVIPTERLRGRTGEEVVEAVMDVVVGEWLVWWQSKHSKK